MPFRHIPEGELPLTRPQISARYRLRYPEKIIAYRDANDKRIQAARRITHADDIKTSHDKYRASEKGIRTRINGRLKRVYGITLDEYTEILCSQDGVCKICHQDCSVLPTRKWQQFCPLVIDHDKQTGKVRGLLCHNCNWALGHFKEKEENLLSAIQYLKESKNF